MTAVRNRDRRAKRRRSWSTGVVWQCVGDVVQTLTGRRDLAAEAVVLDKLLDKVRASWVASRGCPAQQR
jgi:hypothetical protein